MFALFDPDGNGRITMRDLKRVVLELGENISEDEMREMIEEADRDNDGHVTFDDFFRIMRRKGGDALDDDDDD